MISNINKYTIIIPEHNRPEHLKRLLEYFLSFNLNIIVIDSSNIKFKYLNEYNDKVTYKFYPKMDLANKLFKILDLIETPYVVMCADDDFLVPNSIVKIIAFLEKNPEYNSGQGIYLDFSYVNNNIVYSLRYKETTDLDLNSDKSSQRVSILQNNYFQYYYAVFRTKLFTKCIKSIIENSASQIRNLCLLESYISVYSAIEGKHVILPIFYSVRENISNSAGSLTEHLFDITHKKKYSSEYSTYLRLLSKNLAIKERIPLIQAKKIIENSVKIYLNKNFSNYLGIIGKIRYFLVNILKKNNLYRYYVKKYIITPLPSSFTNIEYKELEYIESFIIKYNYIYKQNK